MSVGSSGVGSNYKSQLANTIRDTYIGDKLEFCVPVSSFVTLDLRKSKSKSKHFVLVLSQYRMFLFDSRKGKEIHNYPFLNLRKIDGSGNKVTFAFLHSKGLQYVVCTCDSAVGMVQQAADLTRKITIGFPSDKKFTLAYPGIEEPDISLAIDPNRGYGLIDSYKAYCNLNSVVADDAVTSYIEDVCKSKSRELDISNIPGVVRRTYSKTDIVFDLPSFASAFQYNSYFLSISASQVDSKGILAGLSSILSSNSTLRKVNFVSVAPDANVHEIGLNKNQLQKIEHLQLCGTSLGAKYINTLAGGLISYPHALKVLDLSNAGIGSVELIKLTTALCLNWGVALSLEELNISGNIVNADAGNKFISFISNIRKNGRLKRISTANTRISPGRLVLELGFMKVEYIDLSDNQFEKLTEQNLGFFAQATRSLKTLKLAGCCLDLEHIQTALKNLFQNSNISSLSLDISRNNYGSDGAAIISQLFSSTDIITELDVSDNDFKESGLIYILNCLKPTIKKLYLDKNFPGKSFSEELLKVLSKTVNSCKSLQHLSIQGSNNHKLPNLSIFFEKITKAKHLKSIDISGHGMGDRAFASICQHLRKNRGIQSLKCDRNSLTHNSYIILKQALKANRTLSSIDFPCVDYEASKTEYFLHLLLELKLTLGKRSSFDRSISAYPFEFDRQWPTPDVSSPVGLLLDIPPELSKLTKRFMTKEYYSEEIKEHSYSTTKHAERAPLDEEESPVKVKGRKSNASSAVARESATSDTISSNNSSPRPQSVDEHEENSEEPEVIEREKSRETTEENSENDVVEVPQVRSKPASPRVVPSREGIMDGDSEEIDNTGNNATPASREGSSEEDDEIGEMSVTFTPLSSSIPVHMSRTPKTDLSRSTSYSTHSSAALHSRNEDQQEGGPRRSQSSSHLSSLNPTGRAPTHSGWTKAVSPTAPPKYIGNPDYSDEEEFQ